MARYRKRFQILADILDVTKLGARKTRILRGANLSYDMMERYLAEAIEIGFVQFNGGCYKATEKGRDFLSRYRDFCGLSSRLEQELERVLTERESLERMCTKGIRVAARVVDRKTLYDSLPSSSGSAGVHASVSDS